MDDKSITGIHQPKSNDRITTPEVKHKIFNFWIDSAKIKNRLKSNTRRNAFQFNLFPNPFDKPENTSVADSEQNSPAMSPKAQ